MARHGPGKTICGAQRPNQEPGVLCQNVAGERTEHLGVGRCYLHGGSTPTHSKGAAVEILNREANKLLGIEGYAPVTDPYTALSDLAGEVVKLKDVLRQKVEELTTLRSYGGEAAGEQIDIHMQAYERALDRAEKILSGMARLDLEGRIARLHARINDDTTALIMKAMNDALDAVDMTGNVREVVLSVLGARLRGDTREYRQPAVTAASISTTLAEDSKT